ncbi:MAG: hypothetical protein AAGI38_03325 [Bacteroidota bacterium]
MRYLLFIGLSILVACKSQPSTKERLIDAAITPDSIQEVFQEPAFSPADTIFKDVFKPLDGNWSGIFNILKPVSLPFQEGLRPKILTDSFWNTLQLEETSRISVNQKYVSTSPYFQKVYITDTYSSKDNNDRKESSTGVNKVENGQLLCIVNKPNEQVIHHGSTDGPNTIIWQRSIPKPLKIEYFYETVQENTYTIRGWGYYGDADTTLSPPTWFEGVYRRSSRP